MKKLIHILLIILASVPMSYGQGALKKQKLNNNITMEIPEHFFPMNIQQQRQKYVSDRAPIAMFTTEDGLIDLGINKNSSSWFEQDLSILQQFYKSGILNLYDEVEFFKEEISEINSRSYIVFEFRGTLKGEGNSFRNQSSLSKYIYIQYTLKDDNVFLFNFSAPFNMKDRWQPSVKQMMTSIRIK